MSDALVSLIQKLEITKTDDIYDNELYDHNEKILSGSF